MSEAIEYDRVGDIAVLKANNPPVNALGLDVRAGLIAGVERAEAEGARAILIYGDGRTYFAGADIREFGKPPTEPYLPDVCNRIDKAMTGFGFATGPFAVAEGRAFDDLNKQAA